MAGTSSKSTAPRQKLAMADPRMLSVVTVEEIDAIQAEPEGRPRSDAYASFLAGFERVGDAGGGIARPVPPAEVLPDGPSLFMPAPELAAWALATFVTPGGPFYDERSSHLEEAAIAFLWAQEPLKRQGDLYCGTAELASPPANLSGWRRLRFEHQFREWFGAPSIMFDFLITIWALYAARVDDAVFCATTLHELCHCGCVRDEDGEPVLGKKSQRPQFRIKGHDVEEHTMVVEWFGPGAAAGETQKLVDAAGRPPLAGVKAIAGACGTCHRGKPN